jgi:uncharacterized protein
MKSYRLQPGTVHVLRLELGADVVESITEYAVANSITAAWFTYLGAVTTASLRFFDQAARVYRDFTVDRHLEVLSGIGNVSLLDGAPFVHTHAAFADETGAAFGGHLNRGCLVFSLEVNLQELTGDPSPVRFPDTATGLNLWGGD